MSAQTIETNLERIANALETVAKHLSHIGRLTGGVAEVPEMPEEAEVEDVDTEEEDAAAAKKAAKKAAAKKAAAKKAAAAEAAAADDDDDDDDDDGDVLGDDDDDDVDAETPVTKEQVKKALQTYMSTEGKEKAIAILKKHAKGAENLSQLKEKYFPKVMAALGDPEEDDDD